MSSPVYLNALGLTCAAGNQDTVLSRLRGADRRGMVHTDRYRPGNPCVVGVVDAELPEVPGSLKANYDCRNNQLLMAAVEPLQAQLDALAGRYGLTRIGCVLGTSTSGISRGEDALRQTLQTGQRPDHYSYRQQELASGSNFLADWLGLGGPALTVSTACSSSARALQTARGLIQHDLCGAVIVGGADSLCRLTVEGFSALSAVSASHCKPFGAERDGINIGEASALFLMTKEPGPVRLLGIGQSSDAHHISAPDPSGRGAQAAMTDALSDAGLTPDAIDYLNLHGTGTAQNDAMESLAVNTVFGPTLPVSSTKGMTGHTLGAAGALEIGFCWSLLCDDDATLIPNAGNESLDPALPSLNLLTPAGSKAASPPQICQSNSFAFGGNNISVILGREP